MRGGTDSFISNNHWNKIKKDDSEDLDGLAEGSIEKKISDMEMLSVLFFLLK